MPLTNAAFWEHMDPSTRHQVGRQLFKHFLLNPTTPPNGQHFARTKKSSQQGIEKTNLFAATAPTVAFGMRRVGRDGCNSRQNHGIINGGHVVGDGENRTACGCLPTVLQSGMKLVQSLNVDGAGGEVGSTETGNGRQSKRTEERGRDGFFAKRAKLFLGRLVTTLSGSEKLMVGTVLSGLVQSTQWSTFVGDVGVSSEERKGGADGFEERAAHGVGGVG